MSHPLRRVGGWRRCAWSSGARSAGRPRPVGRAVPVRAARGTPCARSPTPVAAWRLAAGAVEPAVPIAEVDTAEWQAAVRTGIGRARPGARRAALVPGLGHAARAASPASASPRCSPRSPRRWPAPAARRALRVGRGVAPAGAACGPSGSARSRQRCGSRPRPSLPHIVGHLDEVRPDVRRRRLDPDRARPRPRLGARLGRPGARVRPPARAGGEGARRRHRARRPRHQGRRARRPPGARARRRHRARRSRATHHHALRLLRAVKHRFGPTGELGLFEMGDGGLVPVPDAERALPRRPPPGRAGLGRRARVDGHRPLLVEVQALMIETDSAPMPRRSAQGLDPGRLAFLLAVLERTRGLAIVEHDVFALAVGGARVVEPGADLALALAVASSLATSRCPTTSSRAARSGSAASCARSPDAAPARRGGAARLSSRAGAALGARTTRASPACEPRRSARPSRWQASTLDCGV